MALTTLDPKTALIVVDLQKGIVGSPFSHPIKDVVELYDRRNDQVTLDRVERIVL